MGFLSADRFRVVRGICCVGLVCACGAAAGFQSKARSKHVVVLTPWEQAEKNRTTFEAEPAGTHTKVEYTRVMDGYRAIYHDAPGDPHAAEAVNAVAELLAEQGRELADAASLKSAEGQYEFLRTQYPASHVAREAPAKEAELKSTKHGTITEARTAKPAPRGLALTEENARAGETASAPAKTNTPLEQEQPSVLPATPVRVAGGERPASGHTATVTGIRHWSTATYTRVAIDLGDEVTFEAARVPHPDRIYFDLHGAKLGAELVGKSFSVTDDGFLKRIRAAQASPDVTRVVLDVNDVTEYSAFLLPNPYRLIIDIHGAKRGGGTPPQLSTETATAAPVAATDSGRASAAANGSGLPAMATTNGGDSTRPLALSAAASQSGRTLSDARPSEPRRTAAAARPVPNTVAEKAPATTTDVAAVSDAPGRVDATSAPTSKPIVSLVPTAKDVTLGSNRKRNRAKPSDVAVVGDAAPAKAADKTADGETSMIRALGLKIGRIVIDAGHGGHDSGTLGVDGIEEKDVVLDVALRLGKLLHDRLGAEIIYTRSDDTFIPLETRTAIANKAQADLFLSIHANSSQDETARGVETYYLNFTSDPTALDVAARENAVSGASIHQLSDLVKKITLKDKIAESREFASDVEGTLYAGLEKGNDGLKNRGVKKAPFVVLIGANMPSILAEISFVTNAKDAAQLRQPDYRERVAESLYAGVAKYEAGLAGTKTPAPIVRAPIVRASAR